MSKSKERIEYEEKVIKEFSKMCSQSLPPEVFETSQRVIAVLCENRNLEIE